jgi:hypothetical protein
MITAIDAPERFDGRMCAHRCRARCSEARDVRDDLRHRHETVGIGTLIWVAAEPALPVGRQQAQRIPPLAPPRVRHLASLEYNMVDCVFGEKTADREAGVTGTYHDRRDMFDGDPVAGGGYR